MDVNFPYPASTFATVSNGLALVGSDLQWAPNGLTTKATPLVADFVAGYSVADVANRKFALSTLPVSTPQQAAIDAQRGLYVAVTALAGAKTIALADRGKLFASAAVNSPITVPTNATIAFPIGGQIDYNRSGAGTLSFIVQAGVTVHTGIGDITNPGAVTAQIAAAGYGASLVKVGVDEWWLVGALSA